MFKGLCRTGHYRSSSDSRVVCGSNFPARLDRMLTPSPLQVRRALLSDGLPADLLHRTLPAHGTGLAHVAGQAAPRVSIGGATARCARVLQRRLLPLGTRAGDGPAGSTRQVLRSLFPHCTFACEMRARNGCIFVWLTLIGGCLPAMRPHRYPACEGRSSTPRLEDQGFSGDGISHGL